VSDHKLTLDIQAIAKSIQEIRAQLNKLEKLIEEALIKETKNE